MYGILLESVQEYIIQECGEEVWLTILRESGAKNTVFSAHQLYPDTLMLRLASALARFVSAEPGSPSTSQPPTPLPKKGSLKKRSFRTCPIRPRTQSAKCPFSSTAGIDQLTKEHIASYHSNEEIFRNVENIQAEHLTKVTNAAKNVEKQKEFTKRTNATEKQNIHKAALVPKEKDPGALLKNHSFGGNISFVRCNSEDKSSERVSIAEDVEEAVETIVKSNVETKALVPHGFNASVSFEPKDADIASIVTRESGLEMGTTDSALSGSVMGRIESEAVGLITHGQNSECADRKAQLKAKFGTPEKVMHFFGRCFVKYFSAYGYDTILRANGRYFCTFLQSVDNIHQRMRFTFPHMRSPTMQLVRAHRLGAELVYSTTRHGFTHYLCGQLYEIAEVNFKLKLNVSVIRESTEGAYSVVVLRLEFDNSEYVQSLMMKRARPCPLPAVPVSVLLQLFPFGVLFDRKMRVLMAGEKLLQVWGGPHRAVRKCLAPEILRLRKPKTAFTWEKVVSMQSVTFELELVRWGHVGLPGDARRGSQGSRLVLLNGQMRLLEEIDAVIYLCCPIFNDLEDLKNAGLYLADLNGHGLSRELVLMGWQHCSKLELMFEKAENRSTSLEKTHRLRDAWKKRGDQLLYAMIPKPIVDQLRLGNHPPPPEAFDSVTVMFCAVQLEQVGSRAGVMNTVANINAVYSRIDRLLDSHRVYKVETVGFVYMAVSGAPERSRSHAAAVASAALEVSRTLPALTIGVHSGPCVAGVLGLRLPRYCLVGDTVNTASRMQSTSEAGRIQVSAATAAQLPSNKFRLRRRGLIKVKGKGMMETFWLEGEVEQDDQEDALQLFSVMCGEQQETEVTAANGLVSESCTDGEQENKP